MVNSAVFVDRCAHQTAELIDLHDRRMKEFSHMKKTAYLLTGMFLFVAFSAGAQFELIEKQEAVEGSQAIPYEKYKLLSNDLTLIIHEDHSDPIVHVQVAYHVGSARESVRNSGFAHFFEHMMFQGSAHVEDEEHFEIISEAGGTNNAFTSFDKTVYINTAPSNLTETLLWLEADRLGTHLEGFTEKKFNNQRDAVKNEKRQRYDNQPYGMVAENLFKAMYPNHPYEWTPIGYVDDLDIATYEDLKNFFLRWYGPNNATLVVSGDVDPEQVKTWVAKYFSTISKCPDVRPTYAPKPILPTDRYVPIVDHIFLPVTIMAYPTVAEYHPDQAALDMMMDILGGNNNSLLYKEFVKTEDAVQASASHNSLELSGMAQVSVVANFMGLGFADIEKRIREVYEKFNTEGITDEELARVKMVYKSILADQMNSVSQKALLLSHWDMMKGNGYNMDDEIARYDQVTKEDIMRVFRKYIYNHKAVIVNVSRDMTEKSEEDSEKSKSINPHAGEPKKVDPQYAGLEYTPPKDDFDRSVRPAVPVAKAPKLPDYKTVKFDNGLEIISASQTDAPKVYMYFSIEGGHLLEADKSIKTGTAFLASQMMNEGTASLTSEEFSAALDMLGSTISWGSGNYSTTLYVECFPDKVDETLKLLEENMYKPRFDAADFSRIKKQNLEGIKNQKTNPSLVAFKTFNKLMYEGTILEEYYTGDYKSVSKIKLEEVKEFYNLYYSPNVTKMSVITPGNPEEILAKLEFLKKWENKNVQKPATIEAKFPEKTTIYLVDKPYAPQSMVVTGHPAMTYDYNGDAYKSGVMNYSLGGAFNSRINLNLREDKGYTYGARAGFSTNSYTGIYIFSSNIKKEATDSAITELLKEIEGYIANGITEEELAFTKSSILLSKALDYETPFQKLLFLGDILEYALPPDYTEQQANIVRSLTQEDINNLAKQYLKPDKMYIVVVGHAYKIRKGLEALGLGKIQELDAE